MLAGAVAIAAALSAIGSRWAIAHARRNDLFDQPGERRSHADPTPRGGGIGIVVACLLAMLVAGYLAKQGGGAVRSPLPSGGGGLGGLLAGVLGGGAGAQGAGGLGALASMASMLDLNGDGNPLDDILGMTGKRMQ